MLRIHARRYPLWQIVDVYKLAYQAVFGAEHALRDVRAARAYLEMEWNALPVLTSGTEMLAEPLRPDGSLVRLNLRPCKAQGWRVDAVFTAWLLTAERVRGSGEALRALWDEVEALAEAGELPFAPAALRAFWAEQAEAGFPAVHHSPTYRAAYAPAYRVVLREGLPSA